MQLSSAGVPAFSMIWEVACAMAQARVRSSGSSARDVIMTWPWVSTCTADQVVRWICV